jgi:hypothetical protein
MSSKKSTAVATKEATAVSTTVLDMSAMQADAGIGREAMAITDMSLPYISVLQSLSPQVKKSSPDRVEDAEEGDLFNTVTRELYSGETGIKLIPCAFQKAWVEWAPRETGGGFITSHPDDSIMNLCDRDERGMDKRKDNGNIIMPTFYYYCMLLKPEGGFEYVIISAARTMMKQARRWNSLIGSVQVKGPNGMFNPPMFAQVYNLSTKPESNAKGEWYTFNIDSAGLVESTEIYNAAKNFAQQVKTGAVKAGKPTEDIVGGSEHDAF